MAPCNARRHVSKEGMKISHHAQLGIGPSHSIHIVGAALLREVNAAALFGIEMAEYLRHEVREKFSALAAAEDHEIEGAVLCQFWIGRGFLF